MEIRPIRTAADYEAAIARDGLDITLEVPVGRAA